MSQFDRVVILADESANWKVAGLRQLERLALALIEFSKAAGSGEKIDIVVFWKPDVPARQRWLPNPSRISCAGVSESSLSFHFGARVLSTRLFVERNGLAQFIAMTPSVNVDQSSVDLIEAWRQLVAQFEEASRSAIGIDKNTTWHLLSARADIAACERRFLSRAGKSQDGPVSKFLNRPISRWVTRLLLKFPTSPTGWTMSIFVLPALSCVFLSLGGYIEIVTGTLLYQLHSILDGCDGEIARAKYLESKSGGRIDDLCDLVGAFLFVIGLGLGLYRASHASYSSLYVIEGIFCALLIAMNEWLLRIPKRAVDLESSTLNQVLYPRHRDMIQQSGLLLLGENFVWFLVQITKRDVGILFFVLLALAGLPQWILHLWLAVTVVDVCLTGIARLKTLSNRRGDLSSGSLP
ncbi:MAG: CDP-alcohol phosphatidyltransferase family protein [Verrucomicrobiota bacterium]